MRKLPLVLAHMGGCGHGRENSVEVMGVVNKYKPDIVELDIRKSRDGILFCFHGSIPFGIFGAKFLRFWKFRTIRKFLKVNTLEEILQEIRYNPIVYADLKQGNIDYTDLEKVFGKFCFSEIWLAAYTLRHLQKLQCSKFNSFEYVYNKGFFLFRRGCKKVQQMNLHHFQLFPWQCTAKNLAYLKAQKLCYQVQMYCCFSRKFYKYLSRKYEALLIGYDNLQTLE